MPILQIKKLRRGKALSCPELKGDGHEATRLPEARLFCWHSQESCCGLLRPHLLTLAECRGEAHASQTAHSQRPALLALQSSRQGSQVSRARLASFSSVFILGPVPSPGSGRCQGTILPSTRPLSRELDTLLTCVVGHYPPPPSARSGEAVIFPPTREGPSLKADKPSGAAS